MSRAFLGRRMGATRGQTGAACHVAPRARLLTRVCPRVLSSPGAKAVAHRAAKVLDVDQLKIRSREDRRVLLLRPRFLAHVGLHLDSARAHRATHDMTCPTGGHAAMAPRAAGAAWSAWCGRGCACAREGGAPHHEEQRRDGAAEDQEDEAADRDAGLLSPRLRHEDDTTRGLTPNAARDTRTTRYVGWAGRVACPSRRPFL